MQQQPEFRNQRLIGWLLVSGAAVAVLTYSLAAGMFAAGDHNTRLLLMLVLPGGLLACVLASLRFQMAVLALPIAALAMPFDLPTGTESKVPMSMVLALMLVALWCASMFIRRRWQLAPSPLNRPMLVFCVICVLSLGWGIIWRDPGLLDWKGRFIVVQIGALMAIILSPCAALLIGNFVVTVQQLKFLFGIFLGVFCLMLLLRLLNINQTILTIRGLWSMWLVVLAYSLLIVQPKLGRLKRALLVVLIALTFYQTAVVDSLWVSGWLPGIFAIAAITFLRSRKMFVVLLVAAALVYQTPAINGYFHKVSDDNVNEGALERLDIWEQNWLVVREHWLLGTGPAGYAIYYMTYYRETARSTHNNYLDILAQFGFTGMVVWLWLMCAGAWEGWTLIRRAPPGFLRTLATAATGGWVGALASMFLGDWVLPFAYNQSIAGYKYTIYTWIFLGALISVRRLLPAERAA